MAESSTKKDEYLGLIEFSFLGVTNTCDADGEPVETPVTITMRTGSEQSEVYCQFKADYQTITIVKSGKTKSTPKIDKGKCAVSYALSMQNVRFVKKMYSPNEILVEVLFSPGTKESSDPNTDVTFKSTLPKGTLEAAFLNKKVTLKCENEIVCDDYYVHEVKPEYKNGVMYVTFIIYSPDKLMTMMEYCRSFMSKKLWSEIVATELTNYKLPYDSSKNISKGTDNSKFLNNGTQEHIFPYLVQYNESFYDFLKRTTNRWGEFLFYENKTLNIGYDNNGSVKVFTDDDYSSLTFCDLTASLVQQQKVGNLNPEAPNDKQMLKKDLVKGDYDFVKGELSSMFHAASNQGRDVYLMKKLGSLLVNDKTIWGFIVDQGVADGLSSAAAETVSSGLNKQFDDAYFNKKNKKNVSYAAAQYSGNNYNEFSEYSPIIDDKKYADIVIKEISSGRNVAVIDFDTKYPNVKLGQLIKVHDEKYLVVQVEGYQPQKVIIVDNQYLEYEIATEKVRYKVLAIPQNKVKKEPGDTVPEDTKFYPALLSTGHVRKAGTQLAKVEDADDPVRQNRVRVRFDWQDSSESPTPWLVYATPASTKGAGIHGKHYNGEVVIVDYVNGNVENPYVVGAIEEEHPFPLRSNDIVYMTPYGQRILMNDALGSGATAFLASMNPTAKIVQSFFPGDDMFPSDASKPFAGGIELCDTYGIWSIKGSTDQRNISIKSPFGDVNINAFTGITISAPNGDVKIKGKNVSIEAGSNLTLSSGSNIQNKFAWTGESTLGMTMVLADAGKEIAKQLAAKAGQVASLIDLSTIRHVVELFVKPVEGKIAINAGRYLMMGAGGVKPDYPVDAYSKPKSSSSKQTTNSEMQQSFDLVNATIKHALEGYEEIYVHAHANRNAFNSAVAACLFNGELQCKTTDEILRAIWDNPSMDDNALIDAIGFKGVYAKIADDGEPTQDQRNTFGMNLDGQDPNFINNVKVAQTRARDKVIAPAKTMRFNISLFKSTLDSFNNVVTNYINHNNPNNFALSTVRNLLVKDNLPNCFITNINDFANIKNFTAPQLCSNDVIKLIRRTLFIKLTNDFGLTRTATSSDPAGMTKAVVPPAPQAGCSDVEWEKYVNTFQELPKVEKSFVKEAVIDPLLQSSDLANWKNIYDDFAFGSSKKGQILFSGQDGTMVLERNIYRANVDHNDVPLDQQQQNAQIDTYISRIRNAMLQA